MPKKILEDSDKKKVEDRLAGLIKGLAAALGQKTGPSDQHYVTRAYQCLFGNADGEIVLYDKQWGGSVKKKNATQVAFEEELYVFNDRDGHRRYDIEYALGAFETNSIPIIKKLAARQSIDETEHRLLSWYMAISILRTPAALGDIRQALEHLPNLAGIPPFSDRAATLRYLADEVGHGPDMAEDIAGIIFSDRHLLPGLQPALGTLFQVLPVAANVLCHSTWVLLEAPATDGTFVLSDRGIALVSTNESEPENFLSATTLRFFSICPSLCLMTLGGTQDGQFRATMVDVKTLNSINEAIGFGATRFVIGSSIEQMKSLKNSLENKPSGWKPVITFS